MLEKLLIVGIGVLIIFGAFVLAEINTVKNVTTTEWSGTPTEYKTILKVPKTSDSAVPSEEDFGEKGVGWFT